MIVKPCPHKRPNVFIVVGNCNMTIVAVSFCQKQSNKYPIFFAQCKLFRNKRGFANCAVRINKSWLNFIHIGTDTCSLNRCLFRIRKREILPIILDPPSGLYLIFIFHCAVHHVDCHVKVRTINIFRLW